MERLCQECLVWKPLRLMKGKIKLFTQDREGWVCEKCWHWFSSIPPAACPGRLPG